MNNKIKLKSKRVFFTWYDDDPPADPPDTPDYAEMLKDAPIENLKKIPAVQKVLDFEIGEARKKAAERNKQLVTELEKQRNQHNVSQKERDELTQRIDELKKEYTTKEEQLAAENNEWKAKYETETSTLKAQSEHYMRMFHNQLVNSELARAAEQNKAFKMDGSQIAPFILPYARVEEQKDAKGKGTGQFKVLVDQQVEDENGKVKTVSYSVAETVKRLREGGDHNNLFMHDTEDGFGMTGSLTSPRMGGGKNPHDMSQAEYNAFIKTPAGESWRKTGKLPV